MQIYIKKENIQMIEIKVTPIKRSRFLAKAVKQADKQILKDMKKKFGRVMQKSEYIAPRVSLTEEDFEKLVGGEIVECEGVEICLQDIGYYRMISILQDKLKN